MMVQDEDDDDSGAAELLTTQVWNEGSRELSTVDSGGLYSTVSVRICWICAINFLQMHWQHSPCLTGPFDITRLN